MKKDAYGMPLGYGNYPPGVTGNEPYFTESGPCFTTDDLQDEIFYWLEKCGYEVEIDDDRNIHLPKDRMVIAIWTDD